MACCSSQVALGAAPASPTSTSTSTSMSELNNYFSRLMLRELDYFRAGPPTPAADTTTTIATTITAATEVADTTTASPPATGQADPTTPSETADSPSPNPSSPTTAAATDEQATNHHQTAAAALPAAADETTTHDQGTPLRLLTIPATTDRQRRNNGARQQRVYRLAAKFGVSPGAARWVRGGKAYAQPAVPQEVVSDTSVEYNQFMYSDSDSDSDDKKVMLRMPGGWKRDLVRSRPQLLGVAVIDGFLWPRFSRNLGRRVTVDWEEQGFVEFNEVRYTTPFVAREPRPAARASAEEEDGVLIRFDE